MSVAEKPITEAPARSPAAQLAVQSLVGGVFVLASFWILLAGLPLAWSWITNSDDPDRSRHLFNEFLNGSLLLIVTAGAVVGLGYVGLELERANNRRGLREGAFVASFFLYIAARITLGIGLVLSRQEMGVAGMVVTLAIGAGFLFGLYKWFSLPGFAAWLGRLKDSGWFETNVFKGSQGVKIRRMTVIAILILGFWGIITTGITSGDSITDNYFTGYSYPVITGTTQTVDILRNVIDTAGATAGISRQPSAPRPRRMSAHSLPDMLTSSPAASSSKMRGRKWRTSWPAEPSST